MANVAKYDRDEVINKAMLLFWEKGFHATSTRDLQQVTNLRPGSFYAAFGSKEDLFKHVLDRYSNNSVDFLKDKVSEHETPLAGIKAFVQGVVLEARQTAPSELCMIVKTITELTSEHQDLLKQSRSLLDRMETQLLSLLEQAQASGELNAESDTTFLARKIMVQMMGLRTYMRSSQDERNVSAMIDDLFTEITTAS